jgi:hypothetical protein
MSDPRAEAKGGNRHDRTLRELMRDRKAIRDAMQKAADLAERRRALEVPGRTRS